MTCKWVSDRSEQRRGRVMRRGEHPRACFTVAKLDPRRGAIEDRAGSSVAEAGRAYHRFHPRARGSSRGATRPHGADRTGAPDGRPSRGRALGPPSAPRSTERDPQQMTSRTVAGNGPRARDRSGVRRTARGRCRRRPCRRRCGGRRRAVDGAEAWRTGSDTFCARAVWMLAGSSGMRCARGPPRKRARDARAIGQRRIETHLGGGDARGDGGVDDSGHFVDGGACDGRWLGA